MVKTTRDPPRYMPPFARVRRVSPRDILMRDHGRDSDPNCGAQFTIGQSHRLANYILKLERELKYWRAFAIALLLLSFSIGAFTVARITRDQAVLQTSETTVAAVERIIPQHTNAPQADLNIVEFSAVGDGVRAYFYQDAAALRAVDNQLDCLHWAPRDFEVF